MHPVFSIFGYASAPASDSVLFWAERQTGPQVPLRTDGHLGLGSFLSCLQSSTHLEPSTTYTLTLLFIVVKKANFIRMTLILVPF